jgi:hypothetical protein
MRILLQTVQSTYMECREHAVGKACAELAICPKEKSVKLISCEMMADQTTRIEDWEVISLPGESKHRLKGEVFGHPRIPDGKKVTTSFVMNVCDDVAVTTSGTIYHLGKPKDQPCLSM